MNYDAQSAYDEQDRHSSAVTAPTQPEPHLAILISGGAHGASSWRLGALAELPREFDRNRLTRFIEEAFPNRPQALVEPLSASVNTVQLKRFDGLIVPTAWLKAGAAPVASLTTWGYSPDSTTTIVLPLSVVPGRTTVSLKRPYGEVRYVVASNGAVAATLLPAGAPLPRAARREAVWPPAGANPEIFRREPCEVTLDVIQPFTGLIVSRADALPSEVTLPPHTVILVPGTTTWTKLAERGVWVHGSFDGLGEEEWVTLRGNFPRITRWLKLSHAETVTESAVPLVPTYRLVPNGAAADLSGFTHFYWRSGSQFEFYLQRNPELRSAFHGSGPGHTATTIRRNVTHPGQHRVFLSSEDFFSAVA